MKPKRDFKREQWMANYERQVLASRPEQAGKLDWNTANHFYNVGKSYEEAAVITIARICGD